MLPARRPTSRSSGRPASAAGRYPRYYAPRPPLNANVGRRGGRSIMRRIEFTVRGHQPRASRFATIVTSSKSSPERFLPRTANVGIVLCWNVAEASRRGTMPTLRSTPNPAFERTRRGNPSAWRLSWQRAAQLVRWASRLRDVRFRAEAHSQGVALARGSVIPVLV